MIHTWKKRRAPKTLERQPATTELARQKDAFTAEGSPPPGRVHDALPATPATPPETPPAPATEPATDAATEPAPPRPKP